MKRIIKFRAWDGERMKDVTSIGWIDGDMDYISTPKTSAPANDFVLMQFTGLLDKNGQEIYEGDILLNHFQNQKLTVVWDTEIIGSKGGGWNYKKLPHDKEMTWKIDSENVEIIGNIYENPELINKTLA